MQDVNTSIEKNSPDMERKTVKPKPNQVERRRKLAAKTDDDSKQSVTLTNTEHHEGDNNLVEPTIKLVEYLTTRYPQLDMENTIVIDTGKGDYITLPPLPEGMVVEPTLNYYFAGSLATILLSQAQEVHLFHDTTGSELDLDRTMQITPQASKLLEEFIRPIGDIDYVQTQHYFELKEVASRKSGEEYTQGRKKYLWKGGGPKFDEIPQESLSSIRNVDRQIAVMVDPVEMFGPHKIAKVEVQGTEYFIVRPDAMVAYKFLNLLQSYDKKPERFNTDFPKLLLAISSFYSEDELLQIAHSTLAYVAQREERIAKQYDRPPISKLPDMLIKFIEAPDLNPVINDFINKLLVYDQSHGSILTNKPAD